VGLAVARVEEVQLLAGLELTAFLTAHDTNP